YGLTPADPAHRSGAPGWDAASEHNLARQEEPRRGRGSQLQNTTLRAKKNPAEGGVLKSGMNEFRRSSNSSHSSTVSSALGSDKLHKNFRRPRLSLTAADRRPLDDLWVTEVAQTVLCCYLIKWRLGGSDDT